MPVIYNDKQMLDFFKGKSVAIVCSGVGCLENKEEFINSFDIVVRVNNYKTKGINKNGSSYDYIKKVGNRTDVHYSFYGNSIKKSREELISDGVKVCMCKCPNSKPINSAWHEKNGMQKGIDFRWIYRDRFHNNYFPCPVFIPSDKRFLKWYGMLANHVPTTGFSCIMDIMTFEPKEIYLTGYDGFASGKHNVDEVWRHKNNSDPIGHTPQKETEIIKDLYKKGKIKIDSYFKRLHGL